MNQLGKYLLFLWMLLVGVLVLWVDNSIMAQDQEGVTADQDIHVYTIDIPGLIGSDSQNKYNLLFERIGTMIGRQINVHAMPGRRLVRIYDENDDVCVFPEYHASSGPETIFSDPFNVVRVYIVSLKEKPLPTVNAMDDYSFATVVGYDYSFVDIDSVRENLTVSNERQSLNLLLRDRVDAIISYFPDLPLIWKSEERAKLQFDESQSLYNGTERLGCKNTRKMKTFVADFNEALEQLIQEGELEEILSPYYYGLK